jgi:hypothetical protein
MSRMHARALALAVVVLLLGRPSAASAEEWSADHIHSATATANQAAHAAAQHHAGKVSAAMAAVPRDTRRVRTEHAALNGLANELNHQATIR